MTNVTPLPFAECEPSDLREVETLLFDVDDTVTWRGALPEVAARALYRANEAGLDLVAVTGRSASWAELLLRLFPLKAAVAETGALCLYKVGLSKVGRSKVGHEIGDGGERVAVLHSEPSLQARRDNNQRRVAAADRVLRELPSARLALDNMGRVYDTAFDLVEDGPVVPEEDAARMRNLLTEEGLSVAQSSVHINAWFGSFDKATMVDRYLREVRGSSLREHAAQSLYAGDSQNDGAMFEKVPLSVGVANVRPHLTALAARGQAPRFITEGEGGAGFAEIVDALIAARR